MKIHRVMIGAAAAVLALASWGRGADRAPAGQTQNVIFVTTDGLRWQEVFSGAEETLMTKQNGGVTDVDALKQAYWRETPQARREALLPFFWGTIARRGQIFGNGPRGSVARVTNGKNFSYPGYNEMLAGVADPRIDSNDKKPNPNINVLEWLNGRPGFRNRVAAFGTWDVFPFILNRQRSGLFVNAGWEPIPGNALSDTQRLHNQMLREVPHIWGDSRFDTFTFQAALEHLKRERPRVLYIALGETDEFAHEGRYDLYLNSAHNVDADLAALWATVQEIEPYRDHTSLIITTDHGRGNAPVEWRNHNAKTAGSDKIWIAVLGPDTQSLGERTETPDVTQSQVAATIAALVGEDFNAAVSAAAPPIDSVLKPVPKP